MINKFEFRDPYKTVASVQDMSQMHPCRNTKKSEDEWERRLREESEPKIYAYDDVTGAPLEVDRVKRARQEEIRYFKKMGVYKKVHKSRCFELTGKAPIGARWVALNKQDNENPLYR